jgi:large-conductance mechanosensitive channel
MALIRFILIGLIVYLIVRSFIRMGEGEKPAPKRPEPDKKKPPSKKVSKEIGEYIDYEDIKKQDP